MINNSGKIKKQFKTIKESIISNHHILSEKDKRNKLLKMVVIHDDEFLGVTPYFDQTYRDGPLLKKYQDYLNSLRSETKKYCS